MCLVLFCLLRAGFVRLFGLVGMDDEKGHGRIGQAQGRGCVEWRSKLIPVAQKFRS
jgi:hypothetical protein